MPQAVPGLIADQQLWTRRILKQTNKTILAQVHRAVMQKGRDANHGSVSRGYDWPRLIPNQRRLSGALRTHAWRYDL
jgi:hypothetical protein